MREERLQNCVELEVIYNYIKALRLRKKVVLRWWLKYGGVNRNYRLYIWRINWRDGFGSLN